MSSGNKGKRRAEEAALEPTEQAEPAPSGLDELDFEDEFEDEFEEEQYSGNDSDDDGAGGVMDEAAGGAGSSKDAFPDDGVNPSLGGQFYRAGDALGDGEELQVLRVPRRRPSRVKGGTQPREPARRDAAAAERLKSMSARTPMSSNPTLSDEH
jgi:hypothetical protein